jgi:hypothetical protein
MDHRRESDEFRRMRIVAEVERMMGLIASYLDNIAWYRRRLERHHVVLGHITERLGEPEPEEP